MGKRLLAIFGLVAALGLGTPALMADHGDKDKHQHGSKHNDWDDDHAWERRDGYEYRVYSVHERPPGWGHGKKTGWGNCGLPPGQAKKYGCRTYVYQDRPVYYYQDERGQIFVRRPIVEVHSLRISYHFISKIDEIRAITRGVWCAGTCRGFRQDRAQHAQGRP